LDTLEANGKLVRVTRPINKDTEMHPLVRLQYRGLTEAERRAFLFEKVVDAKGRSYDMPVAIRATRAVSIFMLSACNARKMKFSASGLTRRPSC